MKSLALLGAIAHLIAAPVEVAAEKSAFQFRPPQGTEQKVYLGIPELLAADVPVVFVMHGVKRNADEYRDQWYDLALRHGFVLVVPEFSQEQFPGTSAYNLGNVFAPDGRINPEQEWAFSRLEWIFDDVRRRLRVATDRYSVYGHSAGAQFVHRFLMHVPGARIGRAVAANAGWYTMPDFQIAFPYGLRGSAVSESRLRAALNVPLVILLGESDVDPGDPNLRRTPEAMLQGPHRFARGNAFFKTASHAASEFDAELLWRIETVSDVGHDNSLMAPAAVSYLISP